MVEKWPVSQRPSATISPLACHSLCSGGERGPLLSQRPGLKVNMDLWTYPMIIPWAVSCDGGVNRGGKAGGRPFLYEKKKREREKNRANDEREMRSKKIVFRRGWKAQITRSACRSSVLKSIHTIHALGCHVLAAPPDHPPSPPTNKPPNIPSLTLIPLSATAPFFELPVIKGGILTGNNKRKRMAAKISTKGRYPRVQWVSSLSIRKDAQSQSETVQKTTWCQIWSQSLKAWCVRLSGI